MAFANTINGSDVTGTHLLTLFYRGAELPQSIFGDFLSIPATLTQLSPVSYIEANNILGPGADRGFGQLFGASAFNGGVDQYMNAFRRWNEYTFAVKDSLFGTVLAFTPIIDHQILVGRAKGGNLMDPPRGNYAAVQVQSQMTSGVLFPSSTLLSSRQRFLDQ